MSETGRSFEAGLFRCHASGGERFEHAAHAGRHQHGDETPEDDTPQRREHRCTAQFRAARPEERQRQQYGLRNEAWLAIADVRAELEFLRKSDAASDVDGEVRAALRRADTALDSYLGLVPEPLLADARAAARRPP